MKKRTIKEFKSRVDLIYFFLFLFDSYSSSINNNLYSDDSKFIIKINKTLFLNGDIVLKNVYKDKYNEYSERNKFIIKTKSYFEVYVTNEFKVIYSVK